jgi:hypothetical protein
MTVNTGLGAAAMERDVIKQVFLLVFKLAMTQQRNP